MDPTGFEYDNVNASARTSRTWLLILGALLLMAGGGLAVIGGPPRLPSELPRAETLAQILAGTTLPLDGLAMLLLDVAWLAWTWTLLSLVLEVLVAAADLLAHGRVWVRALHQVADRLSVPLVRRAVATAFAVQVIGRTVTVAAAQPLPPAEPVVLASSPRGAESDQRAESNQSAIQDSVAMPTYLVRPGDTLWSIAEKAYGSGLHYRRLVDANLGRAMPNGQVFSVQGVIRPGWMLLAPGASWDIQADPDGQRWYTVRQGDTLSSIASALLGDSGRWPELFELNRGAPSPDGQHSLEEPNTIWPDLRLLLPAERTAAVEPDPPAEASADATAVELSVASTAVTVAAEDPQSGSGDPGEAAPAPADEPSAPVDPPPLLRTPHALQPVVLDPADSVLADTSAAESDSAAPTASPSPAADAEVSVPSTPASPTLPIVPLVVGGLGLAGIAGLAFGARRLRRRLRPLPHEPESEVVVQGGFAEAQLAHDLTRGLHGVGFDPLAALVAQLEQFLAEYDLHAVEVVAVRHGRSSTTITLHCGLAQQPLLLDLAAAFAEKLEADVEACVSADQDVVLRLVRLRKTRLLPTADSLESSPCLVPLGVLYDRQMYAAAWRSLGHVLVVSLPGHGADTILSSLVATLTARRSPEQLRVWMITSSRALPAPLFELPHLSRVVDPSDARALGDAVEQLRAELDWRAAQELPVPDLLVVVPELASLGEHADGLALLAGRAADLGVRLAVASTDPEEAAANSLTPYFATRMVLRMQAEEMSVALLGVADAAFLAGGGRLLLRLDGREPVELYGYRVNTEHLERLVKVMRSAYSPPPAARPAPEPPTAPPMAPPSPEPREPAHSPQAAEPREPAHSPHTREPAHSTFTHELPEPAHSPDAREPLQSLQPTDRPPPSEQPPPPSEPPPPPPAQQQVNSAPNHAANTEVPADPPPLAPIQIYCFGVPRVVCLGQRVWPRAGGDAKPWELLLFLACQPSEGATRDAVTEAMWPEAEGMAEDVNHRFRQLRYRLRRQLLLVPDAPATDGVCMDRRGFQLDPAIVYSDAQEFLMLVREARLHADPTAPEVIERLERARALYVGDLLDGPDVRRYAWLDERDESGVTLREHFRRLIQNACLRLAEAYTSAGRVAEAIDVYHDLTDMDPSDERLFQALFRLCAQNSDLLGLEAEERRMRRLLHDLSADLDTADTRAEEPDDETMQEYRRLVAGLRERQPEPAPV